MLETGSFQNSITTKAEDDDRLDGVCAIAAFLKTTQHGVYYARRSATLPIRRIGKRGELYAFKSELDAALKNPQTLPEPLRR